MASKKASESAKALHAWFTEAGKRDDLARNVANALAEEHGISDDGSDENGDAAGENNGGEATP